MKDNSLKSILAKIKYFLEEPQIVEFKIDEITLLAQKDPVTHKLFFKTYICTHTDFSKVRIVPRVGFEEHLTEHNKEMMK